MKPQGRRGPRGGSRRPSQQRTSKPNRTPALPSPQRAGGRTFGRYLGTALRHTRAAVVAHLKHAIGADARREAQAARDALDSALWIGDYAEADDASRD